MIDLSDWLRGMLRLPGDNRGVTALEYGLIAALVAVAIIGAVATLGNSLSQTFYGVANHFGWNVSR